jgi:FkbM family methyltransferase
VRISRALRAVKARGLTNTECPLASAAQGKHCGRFFRMFDLLHRTALYLLCRHAAGWRGMWRLRLPERAVAYRFPTSGTVRTRVKWGATLEVRRNDVVGHTVHFFGDYEHKLRSTLDREVRAGDAVLDIGANIGVVSVYLAGLVGAEGRVFSVEPLAQNFELLQRNVAANGVSNVVSATQCALGTEEREIELRFDPETTNWGNTSLHNQTGASVQRVPMRTLDSLWESWGRPHLRVVKMDVEGYEYEVLSGASRLLSEDPPDVWIVEFNGEYLSSIPGGFERQWQCFASRGYQAFSMKDDSPMTSAPTRHCDVLFRLPPR